MSIKRDWTLKDINMSKKRDWTLKDINMSKKGIGH